MSKKKLKNVWEQHLDDLENHYDPADFFSDQLSKPTDETDVQEHFFAPTLVEETEIPEEGRLTIDISQDKDNLYVVAPIAGVEPDKVDINLDKDILTIRGERKKSFKQETEEHIYQECYWGNFSRSVILPVPVKADKVKASFKNGVLQITLPKAEEAKKVKITIDNKDK